MDDGGMASVLPSTPATASQHLQNHPSSQTTLGDLIDVLNDLLQAKEVSLCSTLIEPLRRDPASALLAAVSVNALGAEAKNAMQRVLDTKEKRTKGNTSGHRADRQPEEHPSDVPSQSVSEELLTGIVPGSSQPTQPESIRSSARSSAIATGSNPELRTSRETRVTTIISGRVGFSQSLIVEPDRIPKTPLCPRRRSGSCSSILESIFTIFESPSKSTTGMVVSVIVMAAIAISTVSFILEAEEQFRSRPSKCAELYQNDLPLTVEACEPQPHNAFVQLEVVCIIIFTIDYLARIATVHAARESSVSSITSSGILRTLRYACQPLNVIDLIAILPFYLMLFVPDMVEGFRIVRLVRVLRLFKAAKHHPGLNMFGQVMSMSAQPLMILFFFKAIIMVLFASLIYYVEGQKYSVDAKFTAPQLDSCGNELEPLFPTGVYVRRDKLGETDEPTPYRSIGSSCWWVLVTMTTVGYGDIFPTTNEGRVIGVICMYVGIIFLALPISVLGENFEMVYNKMLEKKSEKRDSEISGRNLALQLEIDDLRKRLESRIEEFNASKTKRKTWKEEVPQSPHAFKGSLTEMP
jgi:hypothetical protein